MTTDHSGEFVQEVARLRASIRRNYRRAGYAHSAVFAGASVLYGIGGWPVFAIPCAFVAGWVAALSGRLEQHD